MENSELWQRAKGDSEIVAAVDVRYFGVVRQFEIRGVHAFAAPAYFPTNQGGAGEFLAVELGNNGTYQRLDTYTDADGDSTWHRETYALDAADLSSAVTVRFIRP